MRLYHIILRKFIVAYWVSIRWAWNECAFGLMVDLGEDYVQARFLFLNFEIFGKRPPWGKER